MSGEDRKDVWSKVRRRVEELRRQPLEHLADLVSVQREAQAAIKSGVPVECMRPCTPSDATVRMQEEEWRARFRQHILAAHAELSEALEWTPWKPWKHYDLAATTDDVQNAKMELVDTLCFLLNAWMELGGDSSELLSMHRAKCQENISRQKEGY